MDEEDLVGETKEKLEEISEYVGSWNKYLALTTAFIAVFAAIASLLSGSYSNEAILEKNNAILFQNKSSDQYAYYQAKGIKKNLAEAFYQQNNDASLKQQISTYGKEQQVIKKQADDFAKRVEESNKKSEVLLEKHHKEAFGVTFFQIAIALSAMSALLKRKSFWFFSIILAVVGVSLFLWGLT